MISASNILPWWDPGDFMSQSQADLGGSALLRAHTCQALSLMGQERTLSQTLLSLHFLGTDACKTQQSLLVHVCVCDYMYVCV